MKRALLADGRLWLLSDAGELSSISEGSETRDEAPLPEPALEICAREGHIEAITCAADGCASWTLRRWTDGRWSTAAALATAGDLLLAIDCSRDETTLLTSRRLVTSTGGKQTDVDLTDDFGARGVTSVTMAPDQVYVGLNKGEWGGELRRIDRRTGKVTIIESNESGGLCGGPLNTDCDPVNGIVVVPWKPGCYAAAIGMVHMRPHGRIVEICGDRVRAIFSKSYERTEHVEDSTRRVPFGTVAFFGLARVGDALWAAGIDGVYRIKGDADFGSMPLPEFKTIGNVDVSFDLPEAILVISSVNRRLSVGGSVPLLVPR